jgi:hypothetical protein
MAEGNVGDRVLIESERVGRSAREGEILEVLGGGGSDVHYRVRWQDGHESTLFPSAGSMTIFRVTTKVSPRQLARGRGRNN